MDAFPLSHRKDLRFENKLYHLNVFWIVRINVEKNNMSIVYNSIFWCIYLIAFMSLNLKIYVDEFSNLTN